MIFTANKSVTLERLLDTSGEKDYDTIVATGLGVYIEPFDDEIFADIDGMAGLNMLKMFSGYTNIIVGDRLTDEDGVIYIVKGIKHYSSLIGQHLECIVHSEYD